MKSISLFRFILVLIAVMALSGKASAAFHLWTISQIFSNADGTVQYIELTTSSGGQQFLRGHEISAAQNGVVHSLVFPGDLPGDSANHKFLVATQGFQKLGVVTPDYVVPDGFLFLPSGTVDFAGVDSMAYVSLPSNGLDALDRSGKTVTNAPTNFAGASGQVPVAQTPPQCSLTLSPMVVPAGGVATLTASCSPAATSYSWTGGTCAGTSGATCTVAPTSTTSYTVTGINGGGAGAVVGTIVTVSPVSTLQANADGTVTDQRTGLTWMRCSMGQTWNGSTCTGTVNTYTFDQANELTGATTFAAQSDWRLPNIRELQTILDRSAYSPAIDKAAFPNTPNVNFFSGSSYAHDANFAWFVSFLDGYASYDYRSSSSAVRLVRGGETSGSLLGITRSTGDYVDHGDGTITHTPTNLMWKRCAEGQTWTGSTCSGTASSMTAAQVPLLSNSFAGQTDWRVPTEDELLSLVDYSKSLATTINLSAFPATPGSDFWSASPNVNSSGYVWSVSFSVGNGNADMSNDPNSSFAVRLVRGGQPVVVAPVCTLTASPQVLSAGASATLTASCTPAAASYTWTGGTCAGMTGATCTVTPTLTTTYTVAGTGAAGGVGATATATVTVNTSCSATLGVSDVVVPASTSTGSVQVTSSCAWTATSTASWLSITAGASGSGDGTVSYTVAANTGTTARTGTLTIAGKTFTVVQAASSTATAPVCTLTANPASITAGGSATLTASCNPAATSYIWTGGSCAGSSAATCTVAPASTTTYSVTGVNAGGTSPASSATVNVAVSSATYTVPGTLGNDVFVLTAGNSYYGGGGNDTFILSPNTLRGDVTARIIDTEGDNLIQLVDGLTVTASTFYNDAAQLTLSTGARVQILGASRFTFQLGANALAGDTAAALTYSQFVTSLGASLSGTLPASGTTGYVVPTGFTQASLPVPAVAANASTVPGSLADDVLVPSGANNYLGGGGNDTYIISPYTLSGTVTAKIIDTEGSNVIQLVNGTTLASSSFFNNAVQLTLSNGATVQILGASGFGYQLGANAPAGETATSQSYAQFAATLGASVPAVGAAAVSGSTNFVVSKP